MTTIAIYTDASVCANTRAGGWACLIDAPGHPNLLFGGTMKGDVFCSTTAEIMAIGNALHFVYRHVTPKAATLHIHTDCESAIRCFKAGHDSKYRGRERNKQAFALVDRIKASVPADCKLVFAKVKAHADNAYNCVVDKTARKEMRRASAARSVGLAVPATRNTRAKVDTHAEAR